MKYHSWQARRREFSMVDHKKAKKLVLKYLQNGMKLLDIGCGDCDFFDYLKQQGYICDYHGYDVEQAALAIAKKKGYKTHDTLQLREQFDIVTLFEVLEHLSMEERIHYATLLDKLVKKDGYLILSFPHVRSFLSVITYFDNQDHKVPYPKVKSLHYLFENFKQEKIFYFTPYVNPLKVLHCLVSGLSWNAMYNSVGIVLKKIR